MSIDVPILVWKNDQRIYLKTNKCNETAYLMNTYTICGVCIKVGNEHKVGKQKH